MGVILLGIMQNGNQYNGLYSVCFYLSTKSWYLGLNRG